MTRRWLRGPVGPRHAATSFRAGSDNRFLLTVLAVLFPRPEPLSQTEVVQAVCLHFGDEYDVVHRGLGQVGLNLVRGRSRRESGRGGTILAEQHGRGPG